jgi:cell wall-associated NlpC family hydrolase
VQPTRMTTRRRSRAVLALSAALVAAATGVMAPSTAAAAPAPRTTAEATAAVEKAAEELTLLDGQMQEAQQIVAQQQATAKEAAGIAAAASAAMRAYEPRLRAIAQTGYTSTTQSRVAALLTSRSASDLVQRVTTLDMLASHTNATISEAAAAKAAATKAQADADLAVAAADAGLAELEAHQAEIQQRITDYQAAFQRLSAAEQATVVDAVAGPTLDPPSTDELPLVSGSAASVAIETALAQVGDEYDYGSAGPDQFDCSGLTSYAYAAAGMALPRTSGSQAGLGRQVDRGDLQPGDLVFFYRPISHVGLYIGNGMMVHARTSGKPVAVTTVDQPHFRFGVRLPG